jgi:hypothetical protein
MGMQAQQQQPVYYDTDKSEYYTFSQPQNPLLSLFGSNQNQQRNYLGNPYANNADRFTPKNISAQYPEMNMLFPALNTGLLQGVASSVKPDGAMSGAGRFLSPQTTNTQGK